MSNLLSASEQQLITDIQTVLTPDLLHRSFLRRWRPYRHRQWGHCYAASEALYHMLGGKEKGYTPYCVNINGDIHWYLKRGLTDIDPTLEQFEASVHFFRAYSTAKGFLTKKPSKRAQEIIRRVKLMRRTLNQVRTVR